MTLSRIETLKQFLAEEPADNFSKYALALELVKINEDKEALKLLNELYTEQPGYIAVYYQFGMLLAATGNITEAKEVFKKGMEVAITQKNKHTYNELSAALDLTDDI